MCCHYAYHDEVLGARAEAGERVRLQQLARLLHQHHSRVHGRVAQQVLPVMLRRGYGGGAESFT